MKFACEHCGRSYAVADELRGKTFRMRCRACGQVIAVKGSQAAEPTGKAWDPQGKAEATPSPVAVPGTPPGDEPLTRPPEVPEVNPFVARPVSAAALGNPDAGPDHREASGAGPPLPSTEQYIDLVIEEEQGGGGPAEATERQAPPSRSPRPDGPGFDDPFADWKSMGEVEKEPLAGALVPPPLRQPSELAGAAAAPGRARREPWAAAQAPPARPRAPEGMNPKVLAVAGAVAVAVVAVLLFVYVGRGGKPSPSAPVTAQPAPPPPPSATAEPAPAPAEPIPAIAEPEPPREEERPNRRTEPPTRKPRPVKVAREERRPEPKPEPEPPRRAPQPSPEPPPPPPPGQAAPAPPTAAPVAGAAQPKAARQLSPQQIARIVTANKRAFEHCIGEAGKRDPGLDLSGRQVTLMLTVNSNGKVAYPTIDDVELNKTDLGACIKSAARLMMFPSFEGDPMKVEVPLTLGR